MMTCIFIWPCSFVSLQLHSCHLTIILHEMSRVQVPVPELNMALCTGSVEDLLLLAISSCEIMQEQE